MPNAKQLALRDPALGALVGAIAGADFGAESDMGVDDMGADDFGADDFGADDFGADEFGEDDFGEDDFGADEFGDEMAGEFGTDDMGADDMGVDDFGAARRRGRGRARRGAKRGGSRPASTALVARAVTAAGRAATTAATRAATRSAGRATQNALRQWNKRNQAQRGAIRRSMLDPNRGSPVKVETYTFALANSAAPPVFGTASVITFSDQPNVRIRPKRIITNTPCQGLFMIRDIKVSNVSCNVGNGDLDGYSFGALAVDSRLDIPTVDPSQKLTISGTWSTLAPPPFAVGDDFPLSVAASGPASMVG
jgi:hypothetical protein